MYIQKENAKRFTVKQAIKRLAEDQYIWNEAKKKARTCSDTPEKLIEQAAIELVNLNKAMLSKKPDIWAVCTKNPANLDRGRHWFQVYYILNGERRHFWALLLMDKSNDRLSYGWGFSSGAIGMSRQLDATDNIFALCKRLGGAYAQI